MTLQEFLHGSLDLKTAETYINIEFYEILIALFYGIAIASLQEQ